MGHTPGPWKAAVDGPFLLGGDYIAVEAVTEDGRQVRREICSCPIDTEEDDCTPEAEEDKANARLIAAAPEMYDENLKVEGGLLGSLERYQAHGDPSTLVCAIRWAVERLRAVRPK